MRIFSVQLFTAKMLFALAVFTTAAESSSHKPFVMSTNSAKLRVVDGDSINYGRHHFRLCGIQSPERKMFYYHQATNLLRGFIERGRLTAHVVDIDKYGRKVAVFYANNNRESVNEKMVKAGGAKHYKRFSHNCSKFISPRLFDILEKRARRGRLGLWRRH